MTWDPELGIDKNCIECGLYNYSECSMIQGKGNQENPKIVLIGEAPGPDEAKQGIPFVGKAGKKLDNMLIETAGISLNDLYVTNVVKCYPPRSTKNPSIGFRTPKEKEIALCRSFLYDELEAFTTVPLLMPLGNVALLALVGKHKGITKEVGISRVVKIGQTLFNLIPNYHPAFILRNSNYENAFKRVLTEAWKGLKK